MRISWLSEGVGGAVSAHRHECFEIFWVLKGEGLHSIDFVEYPLQPELLYMVTPDQVHEVLSMPESLCQILFHPGFIDPNYRDQRLLEKMFYEYRTERPFIVLEEGGEKDLAVLVAFMERELARQNTDFGLINALLSSMLRYLMRYQPQGHDSSSGRDERIIRLKSLIEEHFRQEKNAGFYSDQLSMTSKRLNELARLQLGKTVTQLIHDRMILEALRDLTFTNIPVKTIALGLGFEDAAYFSRFFRKLRGETPVDFRKRTFK